jgi:hypothetical protein
MKLSDVSVLGAEVSNEATYFRGSVMRTMSVHQYVNVTNAPMS